MELTYGIREGQLIHVSFVDRGAACGCTCPACGAALVAKKGTLRSHHFAHANGEECAFAAETALHLAAKEILERRKEIVLPSVQVKFETYKRPVTLATEARYVLDRVILECRIGSIVPDVIAFVRNRPLLIEIHVTHLVDDAKVKRIRGMEMSAIEVDLSDISRACETAELESIVIDSVDRKSWLVNVFADRRRSEIIASGQRKPIIQRGQAFHVNNCPIHARVRRGQPYANVIDDCIHCENCCVVGSAIGEMDYVVCIGHTSTNSFARQVME